MASTHDPLLMELEREIHQALEADPFDQFRHDDLAPGHSLVASEWTRFMPARPDDEADLFEAGAAGHEGIEQEALGSLVRDQRRLAAIYFGNWQRDMSQAISPSFPGIFGSRAEFVCDLLFDVIDVYAEAKFGRRLDRKRFGSYRWEEHIDNPRDFGIALQPGTCVPVPVGKRSLEDQPERPFPDTKKRGVELWEEGPGAIPKFIVSSQQYVRRELERALRYGPDHPGGLGLEHFGNAMHTVEDFYAHSNFIEIGLARLHGRGDPRTGHLLGDNQPLRDSKGRYRLTTGVFLVEDTLVSVQKLLQKHIERPPGSKPSDVGEKIVRVLVRRLLGSDVLQVYDGLMTAWKATGIPAVASALWARTGIPGIQEAFERQIMYPLRQRLSALLFQPLIDATARQTGIKAFPTSVPGGIKPVVEISHTHLSKDDPSREYHAAARRLAIMAVGDFWREYQAVSTSRRRPQGPDLGGTRFPGLVGRYMAHPEAAGSWWVPVLKSVKPVAPRTVPSRPSRPVPAGPRPTRPGPGSTQRPSGAGMAGTSRAAGRGRQPRPPGWLQEG